MSGANLILLATFSGCSVVRLARHVRDVEAGSSNLPTPTIQNVGKKVYSVLKRWTLLFKSENTEYAECETSTFWVKSPTKQFTAGNLPTPTNEKQTTYFRMKAISLLNRCNEKISEGTNFLFFIETPHSPVHRRAHPDKMKRARKGCFYFCALMRQRQSNIFEGRNRFMMVLIPNVIIVILQIFSPIYIWFDKKQYPEKISFWGHILFIPFEEYKFIDTIFFSDQLRMSVLDINFSWNE